MKRFFLSVGLLITLLAALALTALAEGETATVSIGKSWVSIGEEVTATVTVPEEDSAENYTVKWYRQDLQGKSDPQYLEGKDGVTYTPTEDDCMQWLIAEVWSSAANKAVDSDRILVSRLPVVYIDLDGGKNISHIEKSVYSSGQIHIQGNSKDTDQKLKDSAVEIKGRGNTTWYWDKKPYKLKLGKKADLFDMGSNKHYVLLANYKDESLLRNTVASDLSKKLGLVQMQSVWVELVVNGEYRGNYQLCEHIRIGKARVPIFDWEDLSADAADAIKKATGMNAKEAAALEDAMNENTSWLSTMKFTYTVKGGDQGEETSTTYNLKDYYNALKKKYQAQLDGNYTGGYLFEISTEFDELSKFIVSYNRPGTKDATTDLTVMLNKPEYIADPTVMGYLRDYWQAFLDAICSPDGYASTTATPTGRVSEPVRLHYSELVDMDSLVGYFLTNEIVGNDDAAKKSRYCYKDVNGLLTFGPVWDFDWGCGSYLLQPPNDTFDTSAEGWKITSKHQQVSFQMATIWDDKTSGYPNFFKELVDDPYFCAKVVEKYWAIHPYLESLIEENGILDQRHDYLAESGKANVAMWHSRSAGSATENSPKESVTQEYPGYAYGFEYETAEYKTYLTRRIAWMDEQLETVTSAVNSLRNEHSAAPYTISDTLTLTAAAPSPFGRIVTAAAPDGVTQVEFYVNGLLAGTRSVAEGAASLTLPVALLQGEPGEKNTVSVIGRDSKGDVAERSFLQVAALQPITAALDNEGTTVTLIDPDGLLTGKSYTVYAAIYDANGVYQDALMAEELTFSQPLDEYWKLFLLDEHRAPVCPALTPAP